MMKPETILKIIANEMSTALAMLEDDTFKVGLTKEDWRKIRIEWGYIRSQHKGLLTAMRRNEKLRPKEQHE